MLTCLLLQKFLKLLRSQKPQAVNIIFVHHSVHIFCQNLILAGDNLPFSFGYNWCRLFWLARLSYWSGTRLHRLHFYRFNDLSW
jgi:hypothetical protein